MVSNHGHECRADRTTYLREVDRENDGVKSLLLPLLMIPLLLFPPANLIFLFFASLAIDVRHPCPPINVGGRNEELIFERCTRVGEFLHILQCDTHSIAFPAWGRDDTFVARGCLREEYNCCTLIQVSREKDDSPSYPRRTIEGKKGGDARGTEARGACLLENQHQQRQSRR